MLTVALALVLGAAACAESTATDGAAPVDTTLVVSSDPELARMAGALLPTLAAKAELKLGAPVRVDWRSKSELEAYLRYKVDEELTRQEATWIAEAYALLGLIPEATDLKELLLGVYLEQVAGFYDPDSTALFVMEGQAPEMVRTVLVHELVHAIQDQTTKLDSITARERGSDRQAAAQAAIEGHATLVMLEVIMEEAQGEAVDVSDIPDFAASIQPMLEAARSQYPALARAPRIIQEGLLYPYLAGAGFVQRIWRETEGRPAPFGSLLPQSTEQVEAPERLVGRDPDPPTEVRFGDEANVLYSNDLGQLGTRIFLEDVIGVAEARLERGWDGDRFALVPGDERGAGLHWAIVWDDLAARDAFVAAVSESRWAAGPVRVESLTVGGRPVAVLSVRAEPRPEILIR